MINEEITIGDFQFYRDKDNKLWLCKEDDELMEVNEATEAALAKKIEEFWMENF